MSGFVPDASVTLPWRFEDDAAYLDLSQRTGLPLATLDGELRLAARSAGAPLISE